MTKKLVLIDKDEKIVSGIEYILKEGEDLKAAVNDFFNKHTYLNDYNFGYDFPHFKADEPKEDKNGTWCRWGALVISQICNYGVKVISD